MIGSYYRRISHPDAYSGIGQRSNYFEGWYFKLISADQSCVLAVIAGVSRGGIERDRHSFIQIINSVTSKSHYIRFPFEAFCADGKKLDVTLDGNRFTQNELILDINTPEITLCGHLRFADVVPFPNTALRRSIMGPYLFVPFMECYHGVVNIRHRLEGTLTLDSTPIAFDGGSGYIEKDSGVSFPSAWIWMQAHEFTNKSASFMLSVADIPWLGRSFVGLLAFLFVDGKYHSIATYNGGKITRHSIEDGIRLSLENKRYRLNVTARQQEGSLLIAPSKGVMKRTITESVSSTVDLDFTDKKSGVVFTQKSGNASLETAGELRALFR